MLYTLFWGTLTNELSACKANLRIPRLYMTTADIYIRILWRKQLYFPSYRGFLTTITIANVPACEKPILWVGRP